MYSSLSESEKEKVEQDPATYDNGTLMYKIHGKTTDKLTAFCFNLSGITNHW